MTDSVRKPVRAPPRWRFTAGCLPPVLAIGVFVSIVFGAMAWPKPRVEKVRWSAASSKPIPDDFRYLMAPGTTPCRLYDAAGVKLAATLDRALANSEAELRGGDLIPVPIVAGNHFVNRADLRFVDGSAADQPFIDRWIAAVRALSSGEPTTASFQTEVVNGQTLYTVKLADSSKYLKWVYSLGPAGPTAIEERLWTRMTGVGRDIAILGWALIGGLVAAAVVGTGSSWWIYRRRRRATGVVPRA